MSSTKRYLEEMIEKYNMCEYCHLNINDCTCYEEVMLNQWLDEENEINDYLNR